MTEPSAIPRPWVSWDEVSGYLERGQATTFPLGTAPSVEYVVGHGGDHIALHVGLGSRQRPPRTTFPMIRIDQIRENGARKARIRTTDPSLLRDFHDLITATADRVVTHGRTLDQAFAETIRAWTALLGRPRELSTEKRIGLLGELTVMRALASAHGWEKAVTAWKGPDGEEHDFGLPGYDVEVKTTSSEERRHAVHGLGQLDPVPGRALWLVSLQLTRGGAEGVTLADTIAAVSTEVAEHAPASLGRLERGLVAVGWSREQEDDERWVARSAPLALDSPVLPRLPLADAVPDRIASVQYVIDVEGLSPTSAPPAALTALQLPS
ncbi:PD-(D/E)XK motif protein [Streptomyces sp. NPDC102364]|uniref:PD-(D/E)XK motif protein n=1 Tax=Streptomyces sp. NPDC102364 TaxID=3366161 RepID=UPI00380805AC